MKSDGELRKLYAVYPDERDSVEVVLFGVEADRAERARALEMACLEALVMANAGQACPRNVIVDLASLSPGSASKEFWAIVADLGSAKCVAKVAVIGGGLFLRTAAGWQGLKSGDKVRLFGDRAAALRWFKKTDA